MACLAGARDGECTLGDTVRVGIYGAGRFANRTHIPNLMKIEGAEVVAACDVDQSAVETTAQTFAIPSVYTDGQEMLAREKLDALYSVVPAFARTDVEAAAARQGVHLFSEKPQATRMPVALEIDRAIREAGVLSTVGFRERYRPLFQEARRLLADRDIINVDFASPGGRATAVPPEERTSWWYDMDKAGGSAFDWGVHAVDYTRFMTGLDVSHAQAFYCERPEYCTPLSSSFNFRLSNGGTMAMRFHASGGKSSGERAWFTIDYDGGRLEIFHYDRIEVDGETVFKGEAHDPWFEQDRRFVDAVRAGSGNALLNDYHDGLYSLAPVLAGWDSARDDGRCVTVADYLA